MLKLLVGPDAANNIESFEEHLARLLLVDIECVEFRRT